MTVRAALLLALLVLAVPPAHGQAETVFLEANPTASSQPVPSGSPVRLTVTYDLRLVGTGDVQLATIVHQGDAVNLDHTAQWSGSAMGSHTTSDTDTEYVDDLPAGSEFTFQIRYTLPAGTPAGDYVLRAIVRQRASGENAAYTDSDTADTVWALSRPSTSPGGGGGGGGGGSGGLGVVTGLSAHGVESTSLHLGWTDLPATGELYEVYRSRTSGFEPGPATFVRSTAETDFADSGLTPGTTYHYRVRAVLGTQTGGFSAQLTVRTDDGPDTTAPSAVQDLRVTKTTSSSVALAWSAASDDRLVTSYLVYRGEPGFNPSIANQVASVAVGLVFTDTGVEPSTTYAYMVRAKDAAGNLGPLSTAAEALTRDVDPTPPVVSRLALTDAGNGWKMSWATDETATGSIALQGPGAPPTSFPAPEGVTFNVAIGDLAVGTYSFTITATGDSSGLTTQRTGRFVVETGLRGRLEFLGDAVADDLEEAFSLAVDGGAIYLVDTELDGVIDRFVDATGSIDQDRAFPDERRFLLSAAGLSVLLGTDGGVDPVTRLDAEVVRRATGDAVERVTVRVADKDGWILAAVADPSPSRPLLGIERGDGASLPAGSAWRDGARIRFLDDPAQDYVLLFDAAGSADGGDDDGDGGLPSWLPYAAGAAGVALGMLLMAVLLRKRRA